MSPEAHEHVAAAVAQAADFDTRSRLGLLSMLALFIGVLSTLGAMLLLAGIRLFTNLFFFGQLSLANRSPAQAHLGAWVVVLPALGGLLVGVIARFGSEKVRGHGIPEAIEAILFGRSRMQPRIAVLKPLCSGIAIGSGGPFGAEGPIIMTGGAAGSLVAQALHVTAAERKSLLVAGACGGMTAVFGTPLAAVLLAVELLLFELKPRSLVPVALSCAVAAFLRPLWQGSGPMFELPLSPVSGGTMLLACVVAGIVCGGVAMLMTRLLYRVEDLFSELSLHWMWWPALGGLVVGLGGFFQPRALGVGYDVIDDLLHHRLPPLAAAKLLVVKLIIWAVALGSGTSGGVLAPLLMIGAGVGSVLGGLVPVGHPELWALVGMAATLGGTLAAPLTAVAFAVESTHGVDALLPVLVACIVAHGMAVWMMPRSIMTERIARRGRHVFREYGVDPLERHFVGEVMARDVVAISAGETVGAALQNYFGPDQRHRAYPVVGDGRLVGMVDRKVLQAAGSLGLRLQVANACGEAPEVACPGETCRVAAQRMAAAGLERMPVVQDRESLRVVGMLSRSDLVKPARLDHEEEAFRERMLGGMDRPVE